MIKIVVAGDQGSGKSSLIVAAKTGNFPNDDLPSVLPPSRLPAEMFSGNTITVFDTSENKIELERDLKLADVVMLTYACDRPETFDHLYTSWFPLLRALKVRVPVIVVGCKSDLEKENQLQVILEQFMRNYPEIETCIKCSALKLMLVPQAFFYAQNAVLNPSAPLFHKERQILLPRCKSALKRIFILCDNDQDGALCDAELNKFQVKCFNTSLKPSEVAAVKRAVPEGVNERGLTLIGFHCLHNRFITKGHPEATWTVLRKFGYDNDLRLTNGLHSPNKSEDQSVELTKNAIEFLKGVFSSYVTDKDGSLYPWELNDSLFSTAPESPWHETPYRDAVKTNALGAIDVDGFLSLWALMTLLDPKKSVEYLRYLLYDGDDASAIRVTRRRSINFRKKRTDRTVFQCFVFGAKGAGKTALVNAFLKRPFSEVYTPTNVEQYAAGFVDMPAGTKKTLVLREIPENVSCSSREALGACDLAIFVYDSSDEASWIKTSMLASGVAGHNSGKDCGWNVPCLILSAKKDLEAYPLDIQNSTQFTQDMGIDAPIPISFKTSNLEDFTRFLCKIVQSVEHPDLRIPETGARSSKLTSSLISVAVAMAIVGLSAYVISTARKNGSS